MRPPSARIAVAVVAAAAAAAAGCGEDERDVGAPPGRTDVADIALTVRFDDGRGERSAGRLACGGGEPVVTGAPARRADAAALCEHVRGLEDLLTSGPPRDRACTLVFGGPQTALVTGRFRGERVRRRFSRTDGCAIADWEEAVPLLPAVRGATPAPAP